MCMLLLSTKDFAQIIEWKQYTHTHTHTHPHTHTHTPSRQHAYTNTHTHMHAHKHTCTLTHSHTHLAGNMHTNTHTHTHTNTHIIDRSHLTFSTRAWGPRRPISDWPFKQRTQILPIMHLTKHQPSTRHKKVQNFPSRMLRIQSIAVSRELRSSVTKLYYRILFLHSSI